MKGRGDPQSGTYMKVRVEISDHIVDRWFKILPDSNGYSIKPSIGQAVIATYRDTYDIGKISSIEDSQYTTCFSSITPNMFASPVSNKQ
jgi:hypothetical protein